MPCADIPIQDKQEGIGHVWMLGFLIFWLFYCFWYIFNSVFGIFLSFNPLSVCRCHRRVPKLPVDIVFGQLD